MKHLQLIVLIGSLYCACAYSDVMFQCDIYQGDTKLTTQSASIPDREFIGWAKDHPEEYASNKLAPALCQTVGLGNGGKLEAPTGLRPGTRVQVYQEYASPKCTPKCKLSPPSLVVP